MASNNQHGLSSGPADDIQPESGNVPSAPVIDLHDKDLITDAKNAASAEQSMSLMQAVKLYPRAIGWSMLLSSTLIMEGYDLALLGNLYASPAFNQKYGVFNAAKNKFEVPASWQSALSNGARAGEILGLILAGWTADRYGNRMTVIIFLVLMILFIFVLFFAPNVQVLVVGEVLCGMSLLPYFLVHTK